MVANPISGMVNGMGDRIFLIVVADASMPSGVFMRRVDVAAHPVAGMVGGVTDRILVVIVVLGLTENGDGRQEHRGKCKSFEHIP